jgi:hypothetical protein
MSTAHAPKAPSVAAGMMMPPTPKIMFDMSPMNPRMDTSSNCRIAARQRFDKEQVTVAALATLAGKNARRPKKIDPGIVKKTRKYGTRQCAGRMNTKTPAD